MNEKKALWVRLGDWYYSFKEKHTTYSMVNRKTYLWRCLLSIVGANQFYARHWVRGGLYLAFCWTGIPAALGLIDWMAAIPMEADSDGKILI